MRETTFRQLMKHNLQQGQRLEYVRYVADLAQKEYSIKMTLD